MGIDLQTKPPHHRPPVSPVVLLFDASYADAEFAIGPARPDVARPIVPRLVNANPTGGQDVLDVSQLGITAHQALNALKGIRTKGGNE